MNRFKKLNHIYKHRRAFISMEKNILGYNTWRGYLHDFDKYILTLLVGSKRASSIHRTYSKHHNKAKTETDYLQMIVDWECARFTKPDKPLNAYETLYKYYPQLVNDILPLLERYKLNERSK